MLLEDAAYWEALASAVDNTSNLDEFTPDWLVFGRAFLALA